MNRIFRFGQFVALFTLLTAILLVLGHKVNAQDPQPSPDFEGAAPFEPGPSADPWQVSASVDSYTTWRRKINQGCSFSDHYYTLDIPADPNEMSDISYSMSNWDVDYNDPQGCAGGPEVDLMYFNGHLLGLLTGADDSWSINSWPLNRSQVISGTNQIHIDTDAPGTGCWCVGVGWIEVKAKLGFKITAYTPQSDDRNRDFRRNQLDLTVTFSTEYDTSTLTSNTFKVEYRDQTGSWQQTAGSLSQLAPNQFRFVPNADLKDGIRYRVTVRGGSGGVKSKDGAELDNDTVWYFWTVPNLAITDNFDYGSGSVCPPSTQPCRGLELTVFQVARNATMVPNKPAVARLYLRWKFHTDVFSLDQVREVEVSTTLAVGGTTHNAGRQTVKRPDRYTSAEIEAASNTINIYHTPSSNSNYAAKVIPFPQTNATPVEYTHSLNLARSGRSPRIVFDYYFLRDGNWAVGVPAAARTDGIATITAGAEYTNDQFPTLGATFNQMGDFTIGYTFTGQTLNDQTCGQVQEVSCPFWWFISFNKAEWRCVYDKLATMRGGHKFVAATVPSNLCPDAAGLAIGNKVVMHLSGTGFNAAAVAHEIGHIYGISTANSPTDGHRNDSTGVEGFQVRTRINRSYTENRSRATSLMHTTVQPEGTSWIHNDDYATLLGTVRTLQAMALNTSGSYLIVSGYVDVDAGVTHLAPAFLQEAPNDPPSATGVCTVELLDVTNTVLASDHVTPGIEILEILSQDSDGQAHSMPPAGINNATGPQYFTVSLPWDNNARKLRVSCGGTVLLTQERSAHAPTVDFIGLANGANLSGIRTLNWEGNDADGPNLAYQLQFSGNNGASWTPVMPLGLDTTLTLNTALLPSGNNQQFRVLVTDGFDTAYVTRTVNLVNALSLRSVLPASAAAEVGLNDPVQVWFVTDVAASTLQGGGFQLLQSGTTPVEGTVSYNSDSRMGIFTPKSPLRANTSYTARLASTVQDVNGNSLGANYQWSFTTIPDSVPPLVVRVSPADAELEVPLNALVQAQFNEAINGSTLTNASFQVLDANDQPVAGSVTYNATRFQALFTPAVNLAPGTVYRAVLTTEVADVVGNFLEVAHEWYFTTGAIVSNGIRIVGNFSDQAHDKTGNGLYDDLTIYIDVEVLTAATYNLNASLKDKFGTLIEWETTGGIYLTCGVHTLQLVFDSVPIRSNGVDGPYTLDALYFYNSNNSTLSDLRSNAYHTFPYNVEEFYSILTLGGLPNQLLEWNTTRDNAFNLRDYTTHATAPITDVTYSIFINTDPRVGVSIDENGYIDINPEPNTETESDVTIEARDRLGNRVLSTFRISVQKPRDSNLTVSAASRLGLNQSTPVTVAIYDQWDRPLTELVTVTFQTTLGTLSPVSVTTASGLATTTLTSGSSRGTAFVTVATTHTTEMVAVEIANWEIYLPVVLKGY